MSLNTNQIFPEFDRQIELVKGWLQSRISSACGYPSEIVVDRLTQRIVEIGLHPFTHAVSSLLTIPCAGTVLDCKAALLTVGAGRIGITVKQWLIHQLAFTLHWGLCLLTILSPAKRWKNGSPAVLISGVGEESLFVDGNDARFIEFCRKGPIIPLSKGKRFIVQSPSNSISSRPDELAYGRHPIIVLLNYSQLGIAERFLLAVAHFWLWFSYTLATLRSPVLSLLARDFAYARVMSALDQRGLIDAVVLTCAVVQSQPLWQRVLKKAKTHMIWYAQNWKPVSYASDQAQSDLPSLRWIKVDTHWVWTRAFANYLGSLGQIDTTREVVGPIMWYLPEERRQLATDSIEIVVFDVPPYGDDVALESGELPNYYSPSNLLRFVEDVVSIRAAIEEAHKLPVRFRLKTKRGYNVAYDRSYFDHLSQLGKSGTLLLEHHSTNVYSLVSSCHLVIAYPFTSAAYVAEFLKVPAVFYDPTGSIVRVDFTDEPSRCTFAGSLSALKKTAINALGVQLHLMSNSQA
ncbi:MAG: hypothetical protein JWN94_2333 [Betaproteobacteria bacterium]|nr:hypothetical protein [Betaproteobacteria bacterium]